MSDTRGLVLGELALRDNLISRKQLEATLARQQELDYERKIGEVLVEQGAISQERLDQLLERQKDVLAEYERKFAITGLFGRMAVLSGFLSYPQLAACLRRQLQLDAEGTHVRIGKIMIQEGYLSIAQFWTLLQKQAPFKCGACGASLETPEFEGLTILCETCGLPALTLDEESPSF